MFGCINIRLNYYDCKKNRAHYWFKQYSRGTFSPSSMFVFPAHTDLPPSTHGLPISIIFPPQMLRQSCEGPLKDQSVQRTCHSYTTINLYLHRLNPLLASDDKRNLYNRQTENATTFTGVLNMLPTIKVKQERMSLEMVHIRTLSLTERESISFQICRS